MKLLLRLVVTGYVVLACALSYGQSKPGESNSSFITARDDASSERPMTQAQGAAILEELRRIEKLLASRTALDTPSNLLPTAPVRARIKVEPDWYRLGIENAPVVMVEFTDLQCPVCQRFHSASFSKLKTDYIDTGKIQFISRDLPLPMHRYARNAAEAMRCAGVQGKFWEFRDSILSAGTPPSPEQLADVARRLDLDMDALDKCEKAERFAPQINNDEEDAMASGINGTPTFVIGRVVDGWLDGSLLKGNRPYMTFQSAIEAELSLGPQTTGQSQDK